MYNLEFKQYFLESKKAYFYAIFTACTYIDRSCTASFLSSSILTCLQAFPNLK